MGSKHENVETMQCSIKGTLYDRDILQCIMPSALSAHDYTIPTVSKSKVILGFSI